MKSSTRLLFTLLLLLLLGQFTDVWAGNAPERAAGLRTVSVPAASQFTANPIPQALPCDTLYFRDGSFAVVSIRAVQGEQIVYTPCGGGPDITVSPGAVLAIRYNTGAVQDFTPSGSGAATTDAPQARRLEPLGVTAFILSVLGIVPYFGILFALAAFILSILSLKKFKRNPEAWRGKGLARAASIISTTTVAIYLVGFILLLILLLVMFL